jgi:chromosome partitioning protein
MTNRGPKALGPNCKILDYIGVSLSNKEVVDLKIISFANQKGGTGKTTAAVNIAATLAKRNKTTLVIDLDPQSNATAALMDPLNVDSKQSVGPLLMGDTKLSDVIHQCSYLPCLYLIPATLELSITEIDLGRMPTGGVVLQKRLKGAKFDYIICDCPPNFGVLTSNGLSTSDFMIVPMEPETFAVTGLQMLMNSIVPKILKFVNTDLKILGILLCRVNPVRTLTANIRVELKRLYKELLFQSEIPIDVRLPESQSLHKPVITYQSWSRSAQVFGKVVDEILARLGED